MKLNILAVRTNPENRNHHLYNNNGTWWIHFHVHGPDFTKSRIRESLGTHCLKTARELRDVALAHMALHGAGAEPARPALRRQAA